MLFANFSLWNFFCDEIVNVSTFILQFQTSYTLIRGHFLDFRKCPRESHLFIDKNWWFWRPLKIKKPVSIGIAGFSSFLVSLKAEEEGFEPSVPLPVRQFSKLFLSATQASLRILNTSVWGCKYSNSYIFAKENYVLCK